MSESLPTDDSADGRRIVLVVGPGRSGTSTVAGALVHCGFEVPGRAIPGNNTNPSGFFEPRWVVDLHKRLLDRADVNTLDTSPDALDQAAAAADRPETRERLRSWLAERLEEQPRLVIKDPRGIWFRDLWVGAARDLGVEPSFVTMLRHPAEVSASRETYYSNASRQQQANDDVTRIGGWINVALTAELVSRDSPRAFVRYTDLVADWRTVLTRLGTDLDLTFDPGPEATPHPADDFIDPSLHRIQVDWNDLTVPVALRDLGERLWHALGDLGTEGGASDEAARPAIDALREEYAAMTQDAAALTRHETKRLEKRARQKGLKDGRRKALEAQAAEAAATSAESDRAAEDDHGDERPGLWQRVRGRS